jgi:hypothetical protein
MKKNWILFSIIFLVVIILISRGLLKDDSYGPDKLFTVKQLQQDFLKLRKILENNHPTLYYFHAKETLDRYFDNVYDSIDSSMSVNDFYVLLSRVSARANCGHTYFSLPKGYWKNANKIYNYFPFKLYFQDGKAYILRNYTKNTTIPLGAEILSINDTPISQIITNFLETISSDGLNQVYKYAKMNRLDYGLFPGYSEFPDTYHISYIDRGDSLKKDIIIQALTHREIADAQKQQLPENWSYLPFDFKMIDSLHTAILTVKDFIGYSNKDFQSFLFNAFESIHQNGIQNLIIDVRNNDGGDPQNANAILSYLTNTSYIYFPPHVLGYWSLKKPIEPNPLNFKGNIYVLIDGGCFSTTGHFLSMIKYHKWGTLIGEESGGSYICNGCVGNYTLPNTKIILNCARCIYRANVHGFSREKGIMPDIDVKPRIEDLINDRDTVMEIALEIVRYQT